MKSNQFLPRLLRFENLLDIPQLVLPKVCHDFESRNSSYSPSNFDSVVFWMLCNLQDFKSDVCKFDVSDCAQHRHLFDVMEKPAKKESYLRRNVLNQVLDILTQS